eukprot:superscaffoldBa00000419_g4593
MFRNIKSITTPALLDLIAAHLVPDRSNTTVDGLVALYNSVLSSAWTLLPPTKPSLFPSQAPPPACLPTCRPLMALMVDIISLSMESGYVPTCFKTASVTPALKKHGLDPDVYDNFRPISNPPFFSKLQERVVADQLHQHMSNNMLFETLQSAYRKHHSTEIALIKITNDFLIAADSGYISPLILIDLSATLAVVCRATAHHCSPAEGPAQTAEAARP